MDIELFPAPGGLSQKSKLTQVYQPFSAFFPFRKMLVCPLIITLKNGNKVIRNYCFVLYVCQGYSIAGLRGIEPGLCTRVLNFLDLLHKELKYSSAQLRPYSLQTLYRLSVAYRLSGYSQCIHISDVCDTRSHEQLTRPLAHQNKCWFSGANSTDIINKVPTKFRSTAVASTTSTY